MANEIDLVVGTEAFAQITKLLVELGRVDLKLTELSSSFSNLGKGAANPADSAALKALTDNNAKLNAEILKLSKSYDDLNKKISEGSAEIVRRSKYTTQEATDLRLVNKELSLQNTKASELAGAYEKLSAAHKIARESAANLGVIQGTNSKAFLEAASAANTYDKKLKEIDQQLGNHGRHVGDYARSWNGLGNSINQITREAPAFANSLNTGFMALSNNIPILADEINNLTLKNKELAAAGKPTQSIFKQVASSFLSWQTLLSLGVTLLTIYGAKLWELATAGDAASKSQKALSDANAEGAKNANDEIYKLDVLYRTSQNHTLSLEQRTKAVDQLQKQYPSYFANLKDEDILIGKGKESYYELRDAIIASSRAKAISSEMDKLAAEEFAKEMDIRVKIEEKMLEAGERRKTLSEVEKTGSPSQIARAKALYQSSLNDITEYNKKVGALQNDLVKQSDIFLKARTANEDKAAKLEADRAGKGLGKGKEDKTEDVERKAIKSVNELQKVDTLLGRINTEIERLKVEKIVANAEELPAVNFQLEMLYKLRSQLNELPKGGALPDNFVKPEQIEGVKQLTKEMQNYLNSFGAEFASKAGLSETFNMLSGNIEGFGENAAVTFVAVAESAQEMFNIIAESSQANFDAEYARLDKQKETSLKFAGDSTAAKEKIDADYDKKKKEIQLREFKAKQKITIANIAIDTAQAIVSTYAQVPKYDFGVSATTLAFIIAGLGAAQIGMVASQKPPAYAEGTDNHSGGLMLVNDGVGSNYQEKVVLPSGKVIRPQGRNVLMNAPKGTKVLNHEQQLFEMLQSNNISMASPQYQGMTPDEMDEILGKHFGNIKTQNTIFDKNGFQSYVKNGNSITRSNSNRSQAIGISV